MKDRDSALDQEITDVPKTLNDMIKIAESKDFKGDQIWQYTFEASIRSRPSVDKSLGLERK